MGDIEISGLWATMVSSAEFIIFDMVWLSVTGVADFTGFLVTLGDNRELEEALGDNSGLA